MYFIVIKKVEVYSKCVFMGIKISWLGYGKLPVIDKNIANLARAAKTMHDHCDSNK